MISNGVILAANLFATRVLTKVNVGGVLLGEGLCTATAILTIAITT